jgi:hypothetical protein
MIMVPEWDGAIDMTRVRVVLPIGRITTTDHVGCRRCRCWCRGDGSSAAQAA